MLKKLLYLKTCLFFMLFIFSPFAEAKILQAENGSIVEVRPGNTAGYYKYIDPYFGYSLNIPEDYLVKYAHNEVPPSFSHEFSKITFYSPSTNTAIEIFFMKHGNNRRPIPSPDTDKEHWQRLSEQYEKVGWSEVHPEYTDDQIIIKLHSALSKANMYNKIYQNEDYLCDITLQYYDYHRTEGEKLIENLEKTFKPGKMFKSL